MSNQNIIPIKPQTLIITPPKKRCCTCRSFKSLSAFANCETYKDGKAQRCRSCSSAIHKKRYQAKKEAWQKELSGES